MEGEVLNIEAKSRRIRLSAILTAGAVGQR
jgi:hypothetical protein